MFHLSPQNSSVNCNKTVCPALTCRNPQPKPGECCYSCPGIFILTLQFSELINRSLFFSILIHHRWIDNNKTQTYRENCADLTKRAFPLSVIKTKSKVSWQPIRGKKYTTRSQTELNVKAKKLIGARDQGVIGSSFESNFLRRWLESFGLILKLSEENPGNHSTHDSKFLQHQFKMNSSLKRELRVTSCKKDAWNCLLNKKVPLRSYKPMGSLQP